MQLIRLSACFGSSIKKFNLPDLGEKIKEATIQKWHVKVGDLVEEFQEVADVSTDKMFTQIPSSHQGRIHQIFHKEQEQCQVGELFLEIEVEDDAATAVKQAAPIKDAAPVKQAAPVAHEHHDAASTHHHHAPHDPNSHHSPAARLLMKRHKIDSSAVVGTGKKSRITKGDIIKHLERPPTAATTTTSMSTVIRMTDFQRGMQKTMTLSNQIPHLYLSDEYDLTTLSELRERINRSSKHALTFMSFFVKAFSLALLDFPMVNSTYDAESPYVYHQHRHHNIAIAMDSPKGLIVPSIKHVQGMSILDIHESIKRLRELSIEGKMGHDDLQGGTVSISNIGSIGGTYLGPLILPPQVCIVGLGRTITKPDVHLKPRKKMNVSFGADHRVLDGATVTRFSNKWKGYLEDPHTMLIHLN